MTSGKSKLEALQAALENYFLRFPRLTVKALSMRTGVPYATLRRIIQAEVNEIKDETIFRIIDRVLLKDEQMDFIREHYPVLDKIINGRSLPGPPNDDMAQRFRKFHRASPHNLIIRMALSRAGIDRAHVEQLTGDIGLLALDEMIAAGLLVEEQGAIEVQWEVEPYMEFDDIRHQVDKDLEYSANTLDSGPGFIRHTLGAVSPEGLLRIASLTQKLLAEVEATVGEKSGNIPFYLDVLVGSYDLDRLPARHKVDRGAPLSFDRPSEELST
ncbi:MAG: hypothetical protein M3Q07_13910 [Pseudobdellovibrionaceae bacterium]|nr:hypothetical protein [Pseudobdellovibrionaceae bacterium]